MSERKLELAVGGLLVAALVVVGALAAALLRLGPHHPLHFSVNFAYAGGIAEGAPAKIGGVRVGRVAQVEFIADGRDVVTGTALPVRLDVEIDQKAVPALHTDAECFVGTQGALGEPYLEIGPGSLEAPPLKEGAALRGIDPPRTDLLLARLFVVLERIAGVVSTDRESLLKLMRSGSGIVETMDQVLRSREGTLGTAIDDAGAMLSTTRRSLPEILARTDKLLARLDTSAVGAEEFARALPELTAHAKAVLTRLDAAGLGKDDADKLRATLDKVERAAASAHVTLARIENAEGTLGRMAKDPTLYEDLRALASDLKAHPWKFLWKN